MFSLLFVAASFTLSFSSFTDAVDRQYEGQVPADGYNLTWKIEEADSIVYKTIMNEIGDSEFETDFSGIFNFSDEDSEEEQEGKQKMNQFFEEVREMQQNASYRTILNWSPDFNDVINIRMISKPDQEPVRANLEDMTEEERMKELMTPMLSGVVLRGSVYSNGKLHSFWLNSRQKNLISLLFELPVSPIEVGDQWTLDNVNFIGNDQNFICRKARKHNVVKFERTEMFEGDLVAVISYDLMEMASGDFSIPNFFGADDDQEPKKSVIKFGFKGEGRFSIEKGRWVSYDGIMILKSEGIMKSNSKQKFSLIPM